MNFKTIVSLFILIFTTLNTFAQNNKIEGNITDENSKETLPGVSIYVTNLKTGTITDGYGNYQITNLKSGTYLLEISFIGYKSIIKPITIHKDTLINFVLTQEVTELNEIIVTGVTRYTELKLSPIVIKTVDRNALNQNSATNVIDAIKEVPGINQITSGAAISKPIIRGLGYNRVITLNNGIKQEGQQWGDEHGVEIDEYAIDRVEIVKGPGSLMYGSDGIAGVLNFLAPKALPIGTIKTQLISNYQSNNNLIGYSISNAGNKKNGLQWRTRFSNKFAGNYKNAYDGKVYNSGFKEINGNLMLGITPNWGHSHLNISSYNNTLNLVEGTRDSTGKFTYISTNGNEITATNKAYAGYKIGFPHQQINHIAVSSNNYFILKNGTVNADFAFQNNKRKEFGDPTNPDNIALFFDLKTLNYNIRYNFEKIKGWESSIGIGGMQQTNANKGLEFLIPAYHLFDVGAFVFTQKNFEKLTFASGLRFDNRNINSKQLFLDSLENPIAVPNANSVLKFGAFTKNFNGVSGSVGISYQPNSISTLKLNLSRGFRTPNIAELSSNGQHEGAFRYEIGNLNLKSEISNQIDLAYFLNSEYIIFELTPFVNFIDNYIYLKKLKNINGFDSIPNPSSNAPAFQFTAGNATLMGGEIYLDIHPHPLDWLHLESSFSYVQATQKNQPNTSKYLPLIPAPKYKGEAKAQFSYINNTISNAYIKFGIDYFFKQNQIFSAYNTETETPAYTLLSAGMGANINVFKQKNTLNAYISAENLTNVAYQSHLSKLKYAPENPATKRMGVFNMGRNISIKLVMNF